MCLSKRSLEFSNSNPAGIVPDSRFLYSDKLPETYLGVNLSTLLSQYKGYIDKINDSHKWDTAKKLSNNFELIGCNWEKSVSAVKPMSRSYYKMLEMIIDFKLVDNNVTSYIYGAIAEGPGGFVESFIKYRRKYFLGRGDRIQCMTLRSSSSDVPNWKQSV